MGKKIRVNYFDVVGRALPPLDDAKVARAVERLSATYRAGRHDLDFESEEGRAAYLWHHLPAHVCDLARLFTDLLDLLRGREALKLVGLGAGPGSEVLALLEAVTSARARGDLEDLRRVEAVRVDREPAWDRSFGPLLREARAQLERRDPSLGVEWTLEARPRALVCDLGAGLPLDVLDEVRDATLVVAANLVSEVAPRGTPELPEGLARTARRLLEALPAGASLLLVDRAGAPGVQERLEALVELALEVRPGAQATGAETRETRCGCVLTRRGQALYQHVNLPTTRDEDRPVRNCNSAWRLILLEEPAEAPRGADLTG